MKVDDKAKREQLLNEIRGLIAADGCVNLVHWYAGDGKRHDTAESPCLHDH